MREALSLLAPEWETFGVDAFSYAYPTIGKLVARTYLEMLRHTPQVWNYLYDNPDVESATREIREVLNAISWPKMKELLLRHAPQAVVCTQAVPCSVFAAEKRRRELDIPLIAVVTDFAIHSYWVYPEVDLYCVASEDSKKELVRHGIEARRIAVTGIPISPRFLRNVPKEQARIQMRLDPHKPTILVMGGSHGLGPIQDMLDSLHALAVQCIVVAGLNRELFRTLRKRCSRERRMQIFGYTRNVGTLMDAADILITKPGGLTSSEALAKGLPMIITNPIPGQEERNARFLLRHGVAERADDPKHIVSAVQGLLNHPLRLQHMKERIGLLAMPYSAIETARWITRLADPAEAERKAYSLGVR